MQKWRLKKISTILFLTIKLLTKLHLIFLLIKQAISYSDDIFNQIRAHKQQNMAR
jgi:hypothetical protein